MPPSSSGPGRGPLKAKTRIRIPLEAPSESLRIRKRNRAFLFLSSFFILFGSNQPILQEKRNSAVDQQECENPVDELCMILKKPREHRSKNCPANRAGESHKCKQHSKTGQYQWRAV